MGSCGQQVKGAASQKSLETTVLVDSCSTPDYAERPAQGLLLSAA